MKHLILLCALALPAALQAQIPRSWIGGSAGNWSDSTKWSGVPAGIPAALDPVSLNNTSPASTPVLDVDSTVASLLMNGSSILAGSTDQTLTISGLWDMSPGITRLGGVGTGRLTFQANGGMNFRNASSVSGLDNVVINLPGGKTAIHQDNVGGITTSVRNGTTINNAGTYEARSNGGLSHVAGTQSVFNNSGTFTRNTAAGTWRAGMTFNNSGTVNVETGTLQLSSGGAATGGAFNVANGTTLELQGTHSFDAASGMTGSGRVFFVTTGSSALTVYNVAGITEIQSGTVTFNNGAGAVGDLRITGATGNFNGTASPTALTISSGTANFANSFSIPSSSPAASLNGGTLALASGKTATFDRAATWAGTTLGGAGAVFHFNAGATNSSGLPQVNGATVNFAAGQVAAFSSTGGSNMVLSNGAVINNAGTLNATGNMGFTTGSGALGAFHNSGTFNRSTHPTDLFVAVPFTNTGTVNVTSGTIRFNNSYTQTAGSLNLNGGGLKGAYTFPIQIQGGSLTGAGTLNVEAVAVTGGTLRPRGILNIRGPGNEATSGNLTLTAASTLDVELGGTTPGTGHDQVIENGLSTVPANAFARNGTLTVRFKNGFHYTALGSDTFTILSSNQNTTGQFGNVSGGRVNTADFKGSFAINAAGTTSVVLSDYQAYPDLDVEQPEGNGLADGAATVDFGLKTIGTPGVHRVFKIKNTGAAGLTGLALTIDGPHAADFAISTPLPGAALASQGDATFTVTFTPTGSGIRTAALHVSSNDPNEAPFDIALTGEGNFAPVLTLPLADVEVEPTDIDGAIVNFTVSATDFEDDPDPTAIASPESGSLFPLGDSTVIVSSTDSRGAATTGTFIVRVLGGDPTATTLVPVDLTTTSATLRATVNPNHFPTSVQFVMDGNSLNPPVNVPAGSSPVTVTFNVGNLAPGSAHTANVQAINATNQFISGGTVNFTTLGAPPEITTTAPVKITPTKARLAATVNPNHLPTSVEFYVGGQLVGTVNVAAGSSPQTVTFDYQQLIPGQPVTYHAIAGNTLGSGVNGGDTTFNLMTSDSTFGETSSFLYAANAGWIHAKPATSYGFRTGDFVCSGFLHAANFGWIHAGTGEPSDGVRYSNTGSDYGINVMADGKLRGYAWSGNIGWICFENTGDPHINLITGMLEGHAWSGNIGWITLSTATTTQLAILDTDSDGISDAWENERAAGNLASLQANHDADGDAQSDLTEFHADTDPLSSSDFFRILSVTYDPSMSEAAIAFTTRPTRLYRLRMSGALGKSPDTWTDSSHGLISPDAGASTTRSVNWPTATRKFFRAEAFRPLSP